MFNQVYTSFFILTLVSNQVLKVIGDEDNTTVTEAISAVNMEQFSYQVSLHLNYNGDFICGGSIVTSTGVLTVAHRMFYTWGGVLPPIILSVQGSRSNLLDTAPFNFDVKNITFHPSFNKGTLEYDLALVEVKGEFPSNVQIEAAITEKFSKDPSVSEDCYVSGWNEESFDFQTIEVEVVECDDVNSNYVGNICIQNKFEQSTLCMLSSGSSLVCGSNLIGVLSKKANCNNTIQISVFESVSIATDLLSSGSFSPASVDHEVVKFNTIWSLFSALFSYILGFLFQYR